MARFVGLAVWLLAIAGCENATLTAHQNDLRLFAEDLKVSIEKAAATDGSICRRPSWPRRSMRGRPFSG